MRKNAVLIAALALATTAALEQSGSTQKAPDQPNPAAATHPDTSKPTKVTGKSKRTVSGLEYWDITAGTGTTAEKGKTVTVHYTGWLLDGRKFDSSVDRGQPFRFRLGEGQVIKGWDEGVAGMKIGGKRQLRIPPDLGYGERGAGGVIPGRATLIFDVELLGVQ